MVRGACLCALLFASAAHAGLHLLPSLRLTAEERYDDDRLLAVTRSGGGQLMTKLSPQGGLTLRAPTLESEAYYAADFVLRHGSGTTSVDHRGALTLDKRLTERLRFDGAARLWRVQDPTSLPRLGMARTLSPMFYANSEASLRYALSRRWSLEAHYEFEAARILEGDNPFGFVHEPALRTRYAASRRTSVGAHYRFQAFLFDDSLSHANGIFGEYRYRLSRQLVFAAEGGPVFYNERGGGEGSGVVPRVALELTRDGPTMDWTLVVGHDLVGANGFDNALWADYASTIGAWALRDDVNVFAVASYFRNGRAPNADVFNFEADGPANGYALGAGVEWELNEHLRIQGSLDRVAQVSTGVGEDLARNIASIRLVFTAMAPHARRPGR